MSAKLIWRYNLWIPPRASTTPLPLPYTYCKSLRRNIVSPSEVTWHSVHAPKTYTKEQLLQVLEKSCPEALALFPGPEAFTSRLQGNKNLDEGGTALRIGLSVTMQAKKIDEIVWVQERASRDDYAGTEYEGISHINYLGLPYATNSGSYVSPSGSKSCFDEYTKANALIKGEGVFGKLTGNGFISPFSRTNRALLKYILLICPNPEIVNETFLNSTLH